MFETYNVPNFSVACVVYMATCIFEIFLEYFHIHWLWKNVSIMSHCGWKKNLHQYLDCGPEILWKYLPKMRNQMKRKIEMVANYSNVKFMKTNHEIWSLWSNDARPELWEYERENSLSDQYNIIQQQILLRLIFAFVWLWE